MPLTAPDNLQAAALGPWSIGISWDFPVEEEPLISGFSIERSPDGVDWAVLATAAADARSLDNISLTPETTYFYRMRSYLNP